MCYEIVQSTYLSPPVPKFGTDCQCSAIPGRFYSQGSMTQCSSPFDISGPGEFAVRPEGRISAGFLSIEKRFYL